MPNWCEGTLKVRGEFADVKRWVEENLSVYRTEIENGKRNIFVSDLIRIKMVLDVSALKKRLFLQPLFLTLS